MIRERRLRTSAHLRGDPPCSFSAWVGLSGKPRVVRVYPFDMTAPERAAEGIPIAVRRDDDGFARIVAIGGDALRPSWWAKARDAGATELHVHVLAETSAERAAVMVDLIER